MTARQSAYRLHIENFLTIDEMDLDLSPGLQGFVGENAAGKTNVLTAVESILNGTHDTRLIKDGEKRSEVRLEEIDENGDVLASVARIQTQQASRLQGAGVSHTSPKKWLATLMDNIAINPMRLISENPVQYLKDHLPIKVTMDEIEEISDYEIKFDLTKNAFDECDRAKDQIHIDRIAQYKLMRHAAEVIDELKKDLPPLAEDAPPYSRKDLDDKRTELKAQLLTIEEYNDARVVVKERIGKAEIEIGSYNEQLDSLRGSYAELEPRRTAIKSEEVETVATLRRSFENALAEAEKRFAVRLSEVDQEAVELRERADSKKELIKLSESQLVSHRSDLEAKPIRATSEINLAIAENESDMDKVLRHEEITSRYTRVREKEVEHDVLKERYVEFDRVFKYYAYVLPKKMINRANLPVEGLEFREQQLYVDERHIDRLSSTERHMVAINLAVALAKAKGHIAICIDGVEIMDEEHRKQFMDVVKDTGIRVIYTRHGKPEHKHETLVERPKEEVQA